MRTQSQNTSRCDFLTEIEYFFRRHLQAAEMDIGGASHYLRLADEISGLACSHFAGCPICRGGRAKWHGAPRAKASTTGEQELWEKVRGWIGVPSFESALESRPGYCWVARLTFFKDKFIRPSFTKGVAGRLLVRHLLHCQTCDPAILRNLVAATPGIQRTCLIGRGIIVGGKYPFAVGAAFTEHAKTCGVCRSSDEAQG